MVQSTIVTALLMLFSYAVPSLASITITLPPGHEECFIVRAQGDEDSHITGSYDMLEDQLTANPLTGTLFDDDYGVLWHNNAGAAHGSFATSGKGRFHLCFGNGSGAYKTDEDIRKDQRKVEGHHIDDDNFDYSNNDGKDRRVAFSIRVRPFPGSKADKKLQDSSTVSSGGGAKVEVDQHADRLLTFAIELNDNLDLILDHQEYVKGREKIHRDTVEETFTAVLKWTVLEAFCLMCIAVGQVIYFRKFFETKRYL